MDDGKDPIFTTCVTRTGVEFVVKIIPFALSIDGESIIIFFEMVGEKIILPSKYDKTFDDDLASISTESRSELSVTVATTTDLAYAYIKKIPQSKMLEELRKEADSPDADY